MAAPILLVLASCVGSVPDGRSDARYALIPAADGLDVAGSGGRQIGFGRDRAGVLDSVARVTGRVPTATRCGNGRSAQNAGDGLILVFENARFVGWQDEDGQAGRTCA